MIVQLQSTDKVVNLIVGGASVPARVWEGTTETGIPCVAFITRIATTAEGEDAAEFEDDLQRQSPPTPAVRDIPEDLIL